MPQRIATEIDRVRGWWRQRRDRRRQRRDRRMLLKTGSHSEVLRWLVTDPLGKGPVIRPLSKPVNTLPAQPD